MLWTTGSMIVIARPVRLGGSGVAIHEWVDVTDM